MRAKTALMSAMACLAGTPLVAADQTSVGVSPAPKAVQAVGTTDVFYDPTRWPIFGPSSSDNEACANGLRTSLSGRDKHETHPAAYPPAVPKSILVKTIRFSGLGLGNYRRTANVLVSWTLRAEAYQVIINPWSNNPRLCHPWHGTITEDFPGGDLVSMLFVNDVQRSGEFSMTFPPLGSGTNTNPSDPTITGSVMLTPATFGGEFPDTLKCEIRWVNRTTGARVKSPANMRNMTLFVTPVAGQ